MEQNKNIVYGGPNPPNVGEGTKSLGEFLIKRMKELGDEIAFIDGIKDEQITYKKLLEDSMHLANCLQQFGVTDGDVVGLISENRMEFPAIAFATLIAGATLAPMNATYIERELDHAVNLSKPKVLFTTENATDRAVNVARQNSGFLKLVVIVGSSNKPVQGAVLHKDFINKPNIPKNKVIAPKPVNIHDTVALILCSSGTTGLPKGVELTHENVLVCVNHLKITAVVTDIPADELVFLSVIPWFHSYGCVTLISLVCLGFKSVVIPKFEEKLFLSCIQKYKVSISFMVPPLIIFLAKNPLVDQYDVSSLKEITSGAAPLSREVEDAVKARIGLRSIIQGYGMSETTLAVLKQVEGYNKPGSVGLLQFGTWAKVVDTETGEILGPNKPGELCFKGTLIMKGYINNEKETRNTIKDGWLHTGDIGYYDDDKEFFIVDRLKELIKYKGFQVPPAELEGLLLSNPKIKDCAVIGLPDEMAGELPLAFIVKQQDAEITEKEIFDFVAKQTSPAKRLHGGVRFIAEIPKNASGKILRRVLRDMLKNPKSKL